MNQPLICTILPTYNERDNIGPLIERTLAASTMPHKVIVVDDNSPDGTWKVVEKMIDAHNVDGERVVLIRRIGESGLTSAIQRGIDVALSKYSAEIVTWMDCDLSMPPEDIPKLVVALQNGADLAIGSRWIAGGADVAHGRTARTLSRIINGYAMLMLGRQVHDYTSGFIAGRAAVFEQIRLHGDYGEYCINLLGRAQQQRFTLVEVPYICVPRTEGESKTGANLWDYLVKGRKYVAAAWRVRFR